MIRTDVLWMWNSSHADLCFCLRFSSCFIQLLLESQISVSESKQQPNASVGSRTVNTVTPSHSSFRSVYNILIHSEHLLSPFSQKQWLSSNRFPKHSCRLSVKRIVPPPTSVILLFLFFCRVFIYVCLYNFVLIFISVLVKHQVWSIKLNYSFFSTADTHFQNFATFFKTLHTNPRIAHKMQNASHL